MFAVTAHGGSSALRRAYPRVGCGFGRFVIRLTVKPDMVFTHFHEAAFAGETLRIRCGVEEVRVTSVLICDERSGVRYALSTAIGRAPGLRPVEPARNGPELLSRYLAERPDAVISGASGTVLPAVRALLTGHPEAVVLVCLVPAEGSALAPELPAGVRGCFVLTPAAPGLCAALLTLLSTDAGLVDRAESGLSVREMQVLQAIGRGRSNLEISRELFLAEQTVKVHVRTLFRKLGVRHRAQAVAYGLRAGLID